MPIYVDEEQEKREKEFELAQLAAHERQLEHERRHQEKLLELKLEQASKQKRGVTRVDAVIRIVIALLKLTMLPLVIIGIFMLLLAKREVPTYLSDYVNL